MNVLFVPSRNQLRKDMTGGFYPWARAWQERHGGELVRFDLDRSQKVRQQTILAAIEFHAPETICFFTHGLRTSLPQLGFTKWNLDPLAKMIASKNTAPRVILYACSSGSGPGPEGDGGFADTLRDALCKHGATNCQVDAHTTAGRADANPYVRRFEGLGNPEGGTGGYWLVAPGDPEWKKWRLALAESDSVMRWDFPFLTREEILSKLGT